MNEQLSQSTPPAPAQPAGAAKDTPESMAESNARYAIDGAIQYGRENRNQPPSTGHWLYEYWSIGQQLRELGKTGWDNVTPLTTPTTTAADTTASASDTMKLWDSLPDAKMPEAHATLAPVAAQQAAAKAPAAQAGHRSPSGGFIIRDFEAPPGLTTTATSLDTATPASTPEASQQAAAVAAPSACSVCAGSGIVDDGEIDCYPNGTPYENGPVKCVKDCPACSPTAAAATTSELNDQQIIDCFTKAGYWLGTDKDQIAKAIQAVKFAIHNRVAATTSEDARDAALQWYGDEAAAIAKNNAAKNTQALMASMHVLSMDAGERARSAITAMRATQQEGE